MNIAKRLLQRAGREHGQILVITALLLVVLLGMVALVVDVGRFQRERGQVQNVVDASALAAAAELPDDAALAQTLAGQYALANDADITSNISFRCVVGDRDSNGLPDPNDLAVVCNPGVNGSFTCANGRCVSLCVPSEGDECNTIVVSGDKTVPFSFAPVLGIFEENTGNIRAAACRGSCGGGATAPLDVVLILDRTGSMDAGELADAKTAAKSVLQLYNPSQQHVALGVLGPSSTSTTCGSPYSGGLGVDASSGGSWLPVGFSTDYQNSDGTLNNSSLIVKTINCLETSSVGTDLGDPLIAAKDYLEANGRANVPHAIILFTDGAANQPLGSSGDTGDLNCSANSAVTTSSGDNNGYQTTPSNACANGGGNAVDTDSGNGTSTSCTSTNKDRHRFYNYNVSIPSTDTVTGISVRLDARVDSASGTRRICVDLSWDGGTTWTATQQTGSLTTSEATYTLGSSSNTWGRTWNNSDFTNANFRVRVTDVSDSTSRDFTLDWVSVRVYHQYVLDPCNYAAQQAAAAKALDIEIFSLGYGLDSSDCVDDGPSSPYYNTSVTQTLADIATQSIDETGCDTSGEATQENGDGDHFYCETDASSLSIIFQQAAEQLAAGARLISIPDGL